ncbi:MAG: cell division topological specificity factor MinE [Anaerolineaceae bacterium]|nr:cell division topological specificity factor MinE [Anaerolineaceae bacterium]
MPAWMDKISTGKQKSAVKAKERLKFVLIHDRTDLSNETLDKLKNEILEVISRYVNIDPNAVQITMNQDGREQRLIADIPIKSQSKGRNR